MIQIYKPQKWFIFRSTSRER